MAYKNKADRQAWSKKYYAEKRVTILAYSKKHREENKEQYKLKDHTYYKENKKKILTRCKKYYEENKEAVNLTNRKYEREHPEVSLKSTKKRMKYIGSFLGLDSLQAAAAILSWSRTVRKRDGKKCTWCNSTEKLVAHHIWHKAFCPESALDVDNGITLCHECHV